MGVLGGTLGYKLLKRISPCGNQSLMDGSAYIGKSKLVTLFGQKIWTEIADRVVIDFGCGEGTEAVEMVQHGARKVIGLDIQEQLLLVACKRANELENVSD